MGSLQIKFEKLFLDSDLTKELLMPRIFVFAVLLGFGLPTWSADDAPPPPSLLENAEIAPPAPPVESIEPEVTIIQGSDAVIEEYRRNGRLYMVKVTPVVGPAYYLVDHDGDGTLEYSRSDIESNLLIPRWVLFSW
jgi:hypothetical protein